jgi:hypothetical protein
MYRELRATAAAAADGQVLSSAESLAVARGRALTRQSLEAVLQEEIAASEKKTRRRAAVPAGERPNIAAGKPGRSSRRPAR